MRGRQAAQRAKSKDGSVPSCPPRQTPLSNVHPLTYSVHPLTYSVHNLTYSVHNLAHSVHNLKHSVHNRTYTVHNLTIHKLTHYTQDNALSTD